MIAVRPPVIRRAFRSHARKGLLSWIKNQSIANRAVEDIPASRPGPIAIVAMVIALGIILTVDNWTLIKRLIG